MSVHQTSTHTRTRVQRKTARVASGPRRLLLFRAIIAAAFLALGARLVFIQVADHTHYAKLSVNQVQEKLTTTALRTVTSRIQ